VGRGGGERMYYDFSGEWFNRRRSRWITEDADEAVSRRNMLTFTRKLITRKRNKTEKLSPIAMNKELWWGSPTRRLYHDPRKHKGKQRKTERRTCEESIRQKCCGCQRGGGRASCEHLPKKQGGLCQ